MKEAMFYRREENGAVTCGLCRFNCQITDGCRGICNVRENRGGTLHALTYETICSGQIDPVEKKPLFHMMPGSKTFSIAAMGCNFHCRHCQNFSISQVEKAGVLQGVRITPHDIVQRALASNCSSISYTYTEPTIYFEMAYETARLARQAGLKNIFVSNGYISEEPLNTIAPFLDAANIDLKGFSTDFYRKYVQADLSEVLDSLRLYRSREIWLEITTLIIPGLNDSDIELRALADFIACTLGVDTPWHVSRFHPTYRLTDRPATPVSTLLRARDIGRAAGLRYVYVGNTPGEGGENSSCPFCSTLLIERQGYTVINNRIRSGCCPECHGEIAGRGMQG